MTRFGIRSFGTKISSDADRRSALRRRRRHRRWRRISVLAPLFAGLYVVAVAEQAVHSGAIARNGGLVAMLKDPLSLFADRSPGGRGDGPLLLTKNGKPHERVLAAVHHRPEAPPVTDLVSPGPQTPASLAGLPQLAENTPAPSPPFTFGPPPPVIYGGPPDTPTIPSNPNNPPPTGAPEPASWTLMLVGLLAPVMAMRRRRSRRPSA